MPIPTTVFNDAYLIPTQNYGTYSVDIVTHLVTSVENGCCPRTLKYLYAVAASKWIVSFDCKLLYLCNI